MRQEPTPPPPNWYAEPMPVFLPIEQVVDGPFPGEIAISVRSDGEITSAVVPAQAVNKENKTVQAQAVGVWQTYTLIALPSGTSGSTLILVKTEAVQQLVA